jgi:hypothetical protein
VSETLKDETREKGPESKAPDISDQAKGFLRDPRIRFGAVAALLLVVGVVAWVVLSNSSSSQTLPPPATATGPVALSAGSLRTLVTAVGQPIYWAGPKEGYLYELTRTQKGNVFIRYLPPGAKVGTRKPELTVATYPYRHALQALRNVANGREFRLSGGGIAVVDQKYPKSVHVAYPGVNYQVEVYDPSPARSRQVALSGDVRPVS